LDTDCDSRSSGYGTDRSREDGKRNQRSSALPPPIVYQNLGYGAIYDMDYSAVVQRIAVAIGSDVLLLGEEEKQATSYSSPQVCQSSAPNKASLFEDKRLTTSDTIYSIKVFGDYLAACGASESITIWSLPLGSVLVILHLRSPKYCNLATHCILALAWINCNHEEEKEGRSGGKSGSNEVSLISGGYDGNVSQWVFSTSTTILKV